MADAIEVVATDSTSGARFDRFVADVAGVSRAEARRLVEEGAALLEGAPARPATRVEAGNRVIVHTRDRDRAAASPSIEFTVAHTDHAFLVVDKPPGLVVHPGAGHRDDTLVNGLIASYPELETFGERENWGLVHRLDRDTSGLIIVARTPSAHAVLRDRMQRREIERRYLALVVGHDFDSVTGTIEAPLARDPANPTRRAVVAGGRPARTHYTRLANWGNVTLLEVRLDTGRTHQIRVHMAAIGAPVAGDAVYGDREAGGVAAPRTWLHAASLDFAHPVDDRPVQVRSRLPQDLRESLVALGDPESGAVPDPI